MIDGLKPYPAYKDSGVPWVGEVPAHWTLRRGKSLFSESHLPIREADEIVTCFRDGQVTLRRNRRVGGFMIALKEGGYQGVRVGQLVIHAMDAFAGAVGVSDADGKCTPEYIVCNPRSSGDSPGYFASLLRLAAQTKFIEVACQAVRERAPRLRYPNFGTLLLPVPNRAEQLAIVRYLYHLDGRIRRYIRTKQKLIKLLEEQKQAIIHRAVTRGLDTNIRLKPLAYSWLNEVPEHWQVVPLRRRWEVVDCKHLTVPFVEQGLPLASVRETQTFDLVLDKAKRTDPQWYKSLVQGGRLPRRGDLIYCRNVSVGAAAFVSTDEQFAMGQDVCLIRSTDQNQRYLNYFLHGPSMKQQLASLLVGSTFDRINIPDIKGLIIAVPPRPEQDQISAYLDGKLSGVDHVIKNALHEIVLLREYRTRLTADVVTGKLDVREAAARLPVEAAEPEPLDADALTEADDESESTDLDEDPAEAEA